MEHEMVTGLMQGHIWMVTLGVSMITNTIVLDSLYRCGIAYFKWVRATLALRMPV